VKTRILAVLAAILGSSAVADDGPGILKIFDQFVVSSAAASKCAQPDKDTLTNFLANYQMVYLYTAQELEKQYPQRTKEQIADAMNRKLQAITDSIFTLVAEKGCADPEVQQVVNRFFAQAKWKTGN